MRVAETRAVPSRWLVTLLLLLGAVFGTIAGGSTALASTYPPPDPILTLSDRELPPNTPFEATVNGAQPARKSRSTWSETTQSRSSPGQTELRPSR